MFVGGCFHTKNKVNHELVKNVARGLKSDGVLKVARLHGGEELAFNRQKMIEAHGGLSVTLSGFNPLCPRETLRVRKALTGGERKSGGPTLVAEAKAMS